MWPTTGRISSSSSKTAATVTKKPLAAVNGNGVVGLGGGVVRSLKKLSVNNNEAYGSPGKAAAAVASVSTAATAGGTQRPVVRAARLPPATRQQKPTAQVRQRVQHMPSQPSKATPPSRLPAAAACLPPAASGVVTRQLKKQLSENRGPPAEGMARCPLCARDFTADRLPKHEEVCRRSRERDSKRKVFDTSRKRLEAVAAEAGVNVMALKKKIQKEDQRAAEKLQKKKDARAARAVQLHLAAGRTMRNLPPELVDNLGPVQDDKVDTDLVKCPHCARTFNEASAERHIPSCADRQRNAAARLQNKKR